VLATQVVLKPGSGYSSRYHEWMMVYFLEIKNKLMEYFECNDVEYFTNMLDVK
jgi:hypothetical protein